MKVCPQCNSSFDDSMFFCLEDGTPLKSPNNSNFEQTLVLPTQENTSPPLSTKENAPKLTNSFEETLALPNERVTANHWKGSENSTESLTNRPINNYSNFHKAENNKSNSHIGKMIFIALSVLLGGFVLAISAYIGWRLSQNSSKDDIAIVTNTNQQITNLKTNTNSISSNLENINSNKVNNSSSNKTPLSSPNNTLTSSTNTNLNTPNPNLSPTPTETATPTPKTTPSVAPTVRSTSSPTQSPVPTPPKAPPNTISGGVLNGKAILLYQPVYPPEAKANKIGGSVSVQVLIDESGRVISANAVNGHSLLKQTSEKAAFSSKFNPTRVNRQPVKVSGIIVYRFVP